MQIKQWIADQSMSKVNTGPIKFIKTTAGFLLVQLLAFSSCQPQKSTSNISEQQASGIIGGSQVQNNTDPLARKMIYLAVDVVIEKTAFGTRATQKELCTATALTTKILLTAAHCVQGRKPDQLKAVLSLNPWDHLIEPNEWVDLESITIHPSYIDANNQIKNDIALIKLAKEIPSDRVSQLATTNQFNADTPVILAGYGSTSPLNSQQNPYTYGSMLNKVTKNFEQYNPRSDSFSINQNDRRGICKGDSGGAAFIYDASTKDYYIIGINSYVSIRLSEEQQLDPENRYNACIGHGNFSNAIYFKPWISETLRSLQ